MSSHTKPGRQVQDKEKKRPLYSNRTLKLLLLFCLGGLSSLSMAPTSFWPAMFTGLSILYITVIHANSSLKASLYTFSFFLGYFGFSLSWIGNALLVENNPYWWVWPFAISGLPLILSAFPASLISLYKTIALKRQIDEKRITAYIAFCLALAIADYARGHLFTGFPWNLFAYSWSEILPIAQLASIGNIYTLNTITIFWAIAPAFILGSTYKKTAKSLLVFTIFTTIALSYLYGQNRINTYHSQSTQTPHSPVHVVVIQPNIKQSEKWKPEKRAQNFMRLVSMSYAQENQHPKTLIIWPETAIGQDILDTAWTMEKIRKMLQSYKNDVYLITGAMRYKEKETDKENIPDQEYIFYNSIITLNKTGDIIDIYDKRHLVPFGEYIPLDSYIKISPVVGFSGFHKGTQTNIREIKTHNKNKKGLNTAFKFAALICYEVIFPNLVKYKSGNNTDVIVNVTNDAWYGDSAGPYQHAVQARFRAIETGLPVIRSANTGISMVIDATGNIKAHINLMKQDLIAEKIPSPID
ncbi:MAG: apolipoprotein N-acyltransferase [Alphaproteobacteria bacterium]